MGFTVGYRCASRSGSQRDYFEVQTKMPQTQVSMWWWFHTNALTHRHGHRKLNTQSLKQATMYSSSWGGRPTSFLTRNTCWFGRTLTSQLVRKPVCTEWLICTYKIKGQQHVKTAVTPPEQPPYHLQPDKGNSGTQCSCCKMFATNWNWLTAVHTSRLLYESYPVIVLASVVFTCMQLDSWFLEAFLIK